MKLLLLPLVSIVVLNTIAAAQRFPERIDLDSLQPGAGFAFPGIETDDQTGHRVAGIGDFNDDGFDDVAVSAIGSDLGTISGGSVYIYFGFPAMNLSTVELQNLDGSDGFRIDGTSFGGSLGIGLAAGGDVNGDGIDDLLIGAWTGDAGGVGGGEVYLLLGQARETFPPVFDLQRLDGSNGARFDGVNVNDLAGHSVSGAGDVNGDGFHDFVIGAYGAGTGTSYVLYGRPRFEAVVKLSGLDGDEGFTIDGADHSINAGWSVSGVGDVNGDGYAEVLIGAYRANLGGMSSGEAYLVFGGEEIPARVELEELDGTNGVAFRGRGPFDYAGYFVSAGGNLDRDEFDDILIGSYGVDPPGRDGAGQSYIIYGRESWDAVIELDALEGARDATLIGPAPGDGSGFGGSGAGDFNGDGKLDVIIGAPFADPNGGLSGEAYVVFGRDDLTGMIDLGQIDGTNGVVLDGVAARHRAGSSVDSAGDFNGDGLGDLIIGSPETTSGSGPGIAHVVFGRFETGVALGATGATCPGPVQLRSKGLTPGSGLQIFRGTDRGSSLIQGGACSGSELDLADAQLIRTFEVNELGQWLLSVDLANPDICGTHIQLIDLTTCLVSNVTTMPEESFQSPKP